ncbi:hypothetical protein P8917_03945 [Bacillus atrophaeus]|uniref:hypothetical protein n=1 Tax=Bacillus atrophaeus TaxID=1452 RepID=UPI000D041553|nr:hypothetical protein [Bacillus atrophaeus]MCY8498570.1 hypothetical protein [Bacillus atrophaeus]MCY8811602.1 hypothetical protein [Bacillus atrophaeus]MCY8819314.1 hypothetical protein [Bacillus atrophaeus]MCY8830338.1 hypothetical protein [Bacillus atrophaeus]MCY8832314.1 hypothetical protein [Bacillus atrophaeus]
MQKFNQQLEELIITMRSLSEEWEKNEVEFSDILSKDYPFTKDFQEVIVDLVEWKKSINQEILSGKD